MMRASRLVPADARRQRDLDLRLTEARLLLRDAQVARPPQFRPAPGAVPRHGRDRHDRRLRQLLQADPPAAARPRRRLARHGVAEVAQPGVLVPVPRRPRGQYRHPRPALARLDQRLPELPHALPRAVVVDVGVRHRDERDALARSFKRDDIGHGRELLLRVRERYSPAGRSRSWVGYRLAAGTATNAPAESPTCRSGRPARRASGSAARSAPGWGTPAG